ncbi:MAG: transposase [Candidatus Heimdallarchaeota archaeon]|nr:transposase [Candidatus Heimdallarchaeota archaeon]
MQTHIPHNKRNEQQPQRGRPTQLDRSTYRSLRSRVERFFGWLKTGFRRLALRWERLSVTFLGFVPLACILVHKRVLR